MQQMDRIDEIARKLARIDSALDIVRKTGHAAGLDNVIELCGLLQEEVQRVAELVEYSGKDEAPGVAAPAEVVRLKTQTRA